MSIFDHHDAPSSTPPGGIDRRATVNIGHFDQGIHSNGFIATTIQSGDDNISIQQTTRLWSESQCSKVTLPATRDNTTHPRPQISNALDQPIVRTPTESTSATTSTIDTNNSETQRDLWKVRLAGGEFLDSFSYNSLREDINNVHSNSTQMIRRSSLNRGDDEYGDNDKVSSTATTKVSNFTFQKTIQKNCFNRALSAYYRPVDSLAKKNFRGYSSPIPSLLTTKSIMSAASRGSRSISSTIMSEPSELSVTIDTLPSGMSSLSYNSSEEEDTTDADTPINKIQMRRSPTFQKNSSELSKVALVKSTSESDDDSELKRMESVTHTFQRNDVSDVASGKMKSKLSAVPLSGIGVDVRNDYNDDQHVQTPREAANASCSISFVMGEIFGITPPREDSTPKKRSPYNIVRNILCSPERVHSATDSAKQRNKKKLFAKTGEIGSEYTEGWSLDVDIESNLVGCAFDYDRRGESCAQSEATSRYAPSYIIDTTLNGSYSDRNRSSNQNKNNREKLRSCDHPEVRQEQDDKNLTFRHYHREDLSYHAGTSCYSSYLCADNQDSAIASQLPEQVQKTLYRDSPAVARR